MLVGALKHFVLVGVVFTLVGGWVLTFVSELHFRCRTCERWATTRRVLHWQSPSDPLIPDTDRYCDVCRGPNLPSSIRCGICGASGSAYINHPTDVRRAPNVRARADARDRHDQQAPVVRLQQSRGSREAALDAPAEALSCSCNVLVEWSYASTRARSGHFQPCGARVRRRITTG
jgi:hypothetical protein